ncbi:hypothetical protein, partial [Nocardioides sp.]|uniref:hypothetical protein n=1 Tax=Nocardioides sp. TaxID=35761 RepID=UPI003569441A
MIKKTLLGLMTVGLLSLAPVAQSQASTQSADSASVGAPQAKKRIAYISGYVRNQLGKYQDDVSVAVLNANDLGATPLASALTYSGEDFGHGFYNIELKYEPAVVTSIVIRFSSLDTVPRNLRFKTYTTAPLALKRNYQFFDLPDIRMKLATKVASAASAAVHAAKKGQPVGKALKEITEGDGSVLAVQVGVAKGQPKILKMLGEVTFSVTQGSKTVKFQDPSTKRKKLVTELKQALEPTRQAGDSAAVVVLPHLAGSTPYTVEVCETKTVKGKKKKVCRDEERFTASESYTLHVSYPGSDEARGS